jgi:asparagine N-glycosylation enzyme membrane subunit Stt3
MLLVMASLPFNPLLNQRRLVYLLTPVCVALGLAAMYICTLPDKPKGRDGGAA